MTISYDKYQEDKQNNELKNDKTNKIYKIYSWTEPNENKFKTSLM